MMKKTVAAMVGVAGCMGESSPAVGFAPVHPPQVVPDGWVVMPGKDVDKTGHMDVMVGLKRSNMDKMQNLFDEASTPGHKNYLNHASWKEMGEMVRPSEQAVGAVVGMLASKGAINIHVATHGDYIKASVPMQDLEDLTESPFYIFEHPATGRQIARLADGVKLPADVAKHVDTFTGLHGFPLDPVVAESTNTSASGDVTPAVIAKAYGIDAKTVTRSGKSNIQAIGQFQAQYVSPSDLSMFCKQYDANANCAISKFIGKNVGTQPGVESMLDVEYMMGIGKDQTTWVYSYPNNNFCADLLTWANDVASESEHPNVVSLSYGSQKIDFCDATTRTRLSQDVQKLGAMGISVIIASGDDGSGGISRQGSNNGKLSPSFPASIPYALAVGSTFFDSGLSGEEMATTQFGSGGGFSYDYDIPSYQAAAVKSYLATNPKTGTNTYATKGRGSPDVSLLGEKFAVIIGSGQTIAVGGTSASTPSWGAIVSLLNEECLSASAGKKTLGFVNPLFYQNPDAFNDITQGSNAVGENAKSGWKCEKGWDAVTGLGTPQFTKLQAVVKKACGAANNTVIV